MPFACSITIRDVSARRSCSFSSSIEATSSSSRATAPSPSARETSRSLGLLSRGPADKPVHPLRERALDAEHPVEAWDLEHAEDSWIVGDDQALRSSRIVLDLPPQVRDVDVACALVAHVGAVPEVLHDLAAREHPVGLTRQERQQ